MKTWKKVLLIVGFIMVAIIGVFIFALYKGLQETPEVTAKVNNFLQYTSDGNYGDAYNLFSSKVTESLSLDEFSATFNDPKAKLLYSNFDKQEQTAFNIRSSIGGSTQYQYTGLITYQDSSTAWLSVSLVKEAGEYKIYGINIAPNL